MRIIFVDHKTHAIKEDKQSFPSLVDAVAALDKLLSQGLAMFGQVLDKDGRVLANRAYVGERDNASATAKTSS